jgi:hypothetical protein
MSPIRGAGGLRRIDAHGDPGDLREAAVEPRELRDAVLQRAAQVGAGDLDQAFSMDH